MIYRNCLRLLQEISKIEDQIVNLEGQIQKQRPSLMNSKEALIRRYLENKINSRKN